MDMHTLTVYPIKALSRKIELSFVACNQSGFRHDYTGIFCHHRISHFNCSYIIRIITSWKFDQIMLIPIGCFARTMNGVVFIVHGYQCFGARTTGRTTCPTQNGNDVTYIAFKHHSCISGKFIKAYGGLLISVPAARREALVAELESAGVPTRAVVGEIVDRQDLGEGTLIDVTA